MIYQIIYILEILIVFSCIHAVYGERVHITWKEASIFLILILIMNVAGHYPAEGSALLYIVLTVYCTKCFQRRRKEHLINFVLYLTAGAIIEFIGNVIASFIVKENVLLITVCAESIGLVVCILGLKYLKLYKLATWATKQNIIFYIALAYIGLLIFSMIIKYKVYGGIIKENYVWAIPLIIFVILISGKWAEYQQYYEEKEKELDVYSKGKESLQGLIKKIRIRQHEMNNHITAILAMHYTNATYEGLVQAQREYCEQIVEENKYNMLLALNESILIGFLYEKFKCIEDKGISIVCNIKVGDYKPSVPDYYLVEMLGILLDNAVEAISLQEEKQSIEVEILEKSEGYHYIVRNPYHYISEAEIDTWFEFERSSKGLDRGMGLYHLKSLCMEWNCYVGCECRQISEKFFIEFIIETGRAV